MLIIADLFSSPSIVFLSFVFFFLIVRHVHLLKKSSPFSHLTFDSHSLTTAPCYLVIGCILQEHMPVLALCDHERILLVTVTAWFACLVFQVVILYAVVYQGWVLAPDAGLCAALGCHPMTVQLCETELPAAELPTEELCGLDPHPTQGQSLLIADTRSFGGFGVVSTVIYQVMTKSTGFSPALYFYFPFVSCGFLCGGVKSHYVVIAGLEFSVRDPPAPVLQVLGLKVQAIMPGLFISCFILLVFNFSDFDVFFWEH